MNRNGSWAKHREVRVFRCVEQGTRLGEQAQWVQTQPDHPGEGGAEISCDSLSRRFMALTSLT